MVRSTFLYLASRLAQVHNDPATPGAVVNVLLAILIGSFSLALLAPEMQGKCISWEFCNVY
jgi:hypothetical protein